MVCGGGTSQILPQWQKGSSRPLLFLRKLVLLLRAELHSSGMRKSARGARQQGTSQALLRGKGRGLVAPAATVDIFVPIPPWGLCPERLNFPYSGLARGARVAASR